jgi:probable phosphoglycerate mutase
VIEPDLKEWDYGDYEGRTTAEIRDERPGWDLWSDGPLHGETLEQAAARARRVLQRVLDQSRSANDCDVALFAHGHILRILTACWLGLDPDAGRLFALSTGSVSVLGYEHETQVIRSWNVEVR